MNDPNGLIYHDGEYHLFYQHNPYAAEWGHMSLGHAVSPDLVHWRHLPIAIPEEPEQGCTIFSGSAVVDGENVSGFGQAGRPPLVAFYTADHRRDKALQTIHLAYSTDRGRTFSKYARNPIIDVQNAKFGDPKVFWHAPSGQWIMVNILGRQQGRVALYGSYDLKAWRMLSVFRAPEEAPGMWECPDLFPLLLDGDPQQVKWVLKVNWVDVEQGPWGSRYFVGDFDGRRFKNGALTAQPLLPDQDPFYAEVTYNGVPDGRRIIIGWLRQRPDSARPWTGLQSIPRTLKLRSSGDGFRLCQEPVREMQALRREQHAFRDQAISGDAPLLSNVSASELELAALFDPGSAAEVGFRLRLDGGAEAVVGYSRATDELFARTERARSALSLPLQGGRLKLHVFVDRSVVEVFGGDGASVTTALLEPHAVCQAVAPYAQGGSARLVELRTWRLASALKKSMQK